MTFFISTSFLAVFVVLSGTDSSLFTPTYQAGLIGVQSNQNNLTFFAVNKDSLLWWGITIVFFTLLGFYIGRFVDFKRSEYIVNKNVNG